MGDDRLSDSEVGALDAHLNRAIVERHLDGRRVAARHHH